jgi:hypothetical protein
MKKLAITFLLLVFTAQTGLCDLHHYGHARSGDPDPALDAFLMTSVLILAASAAILLIAGPVLLIRMQRIRDLFWTVPLVNTIFYILSISLMTYPGGFLAKFQSLGLPNTILEIVLLLVSSLIVALILAIIKWFIQTMKQFTKKQESPD